MTSPIASCAWIAGLSHPAAAVIGLALTAAGYSLVLETSAGEDVAAALPPWAANLPAAAAVTQVASDGGAAEGPFGVLVTIAPPPRSAQPVWAAAPEPWVAETVGRVQRFVAGLAAGSDAVVLTICNAAARDAVGPGMTEAAVGAFTRRAALALAPRRVRVNAIVLDASLAGNGMEALAPQSSGGTNGRLQPGSTAHDLGCVVTAILSYPSMTGQVLRLALPAGQPR